MAKAKVAGLRWTGPDQWHVTLRFLGSIDPGEVAAALDRLGSAVTGVAGPEHLGGEPPGTVWMATSVDEVVEALRVAFPADRAQVRQFTVITVLNLLRLRLLARRGA